MEIIFIPLLALALLSLALPTIFKLLHSSRRRLHRNLPPGPKSWPIIGNINLVGSIPHRSLHSLSQTYGEIMQLKFGNVPVVVASSPEMARQFLRVHDANFASRPPLAAIKYTANNYSNLLWAPLLWVPYGPDWRQSRKIYLTEVFSAKRLEFFEPIRAQERRRFHSRLFSLSGKPVLIRDHVSSYTLSTMCRIVLGDDYFFQMQETSAAFRFEELQQMLNEWMLLNGFVNVEDWIPWLSFLDLQGYGKRIRNLYNKFDRFHNHVIDEHLAIRAMAAAEKPAIPIDIVHTLLQLVEDQPSSLEVELTRDFIKGLVQDLLAGGTDTAAGIVEWAIHEVLRHPRVISKAKEELDRVIGRNRWVEEMDLPQLTYINAIIMETMRLHPLSPLLPPHYAIDDCKVAGYDIAKGTIVMVNTYSLGRDPKSWDAAEEFLPERFMGKEVDVMGGNFALLPFGWGRRSCPGYKLGMKIIGTMLSNLLHGFELKLEEGMRPQDICFDEVYGLIQNPKIPLSIITEPTLPSYLY